jgi:hypothetical protein
MWCTALCPISVLALLDAVSSYLERVSLRCLPNKTLLHKIRRMDPAGFEPASATWTECCVAVTPRALKRVFLMPRGTARWSVIIFVRLCRIGITRRATRSAEFSWAYDYAWQDLGATSVVPTCRKSRQVGQPRHRPHQRCGMQSQIPRPVAKSATRTGHPREFE